MQKTRPQNIDIWPNGGHFMSMTDIWQSCQKILKITKSRSFFEIFPPFFAYGPKIIISQYYIWVTTLKNAPLYFLEGGAESAPPRGSQQPRVPVGERVKHPVKWRLKRNLAKTNRHR